MRETIRDFCALWHRVLILALLLLIEQTARSATTFTSIGIPDAYGIRVVSVDQLLDPHSGLTEIVRSRLTACPAIHETVRALTINPSRPIKSIIIRTLTNTQDRTVVGTNELVLSELVSQTPSRTGGYIFIAPRSAISSYLNISGRNPSLTATPSECLIAKPAGLTLNVSIDSIVFNDGEVLGPDIWGVEKRAGDWRKCIARLAVILRQEVHAQSIIDQLSSLIAANEAKIKDFDLNDPIFEAQGYVRFGKLARSALESGKSPQWVAEHLPLVTTNTPLVLYRKVPQ
jgi:hypothetical protein